MKLAMRMVPTVGGASEARPFLSLETSAHSSVHMLQDLPITQPFAPSGVRPHSTPIRPPPFPIATPPSLSPLNAHQTPLTKSIEVGCNQSLR